MAKADCKTVQEDFHKSPLVRKMEMVSFLASYMMVLVHCKMAKIDCKMEQEDFRKCHPVDKTAMVSSLVFCTRLLVHCKMASFPVSCTMELVHYMTVVPHRGFDPMVRMSLKLNLCFITILDKHPFNVIYNRYPNI